MSEEEAAEGEKVGILYQGELRQAQEYEALLQSHGLRAMVVPPPPDQASP